MSCNCGKIRKRDVARFLYALFFQFVVPALKTRACIFLCVHSFSPHHFSLFVPVPAELSPTCLKLTFSPFCPFRNCFSFTTILKRHFNFVFQKTRFLERNLCQLRILNRHIQMKQYILFSKTNFL